MKAGLLFDGIGGFPLGFQRAGIDNVWSVEIDEACHRLLGRRFPDTRHFRDVQQIGPWIEKACGEVDVIAGGFPCQDISVAGHRTGLDGERSRLWWEFHRIIGEQLPRWCLIENVAGLLSSNRGRDMGAILGSLADLGYGFAYRVLDAQGFGVPQRRRRVFIVGCLGDAAGPAEVLLEPESGGGDLAPSEQQKATIAGTARGGIEDGGRRPLLAETGVVSALSSRMGTSGHGDLANAQAGWLIPFRKSTRSHGKDVNDEVWVDDGRANTLNTYENTDIRTTHLVAFNVYPGSDTERMDLGVRRLTPLECERLQGFPDEWTAGQPDSTRHKQLGNAVAVPVVEWIGRRIKEVHERG